MSSDNETTQAREQYATAHAAHYTGKDLLGALGLYQALLSGFPESQEAAYSRAQIGNIVRAAVPIKVLFDAQAKLARTYLEDANEPSEVAALAPASGLHDVSRSPEQEV